MQVNCKKAICTKIILLMNIRNGLKFCFIMLIICALSTSCKNKSADEANAKNGELVSGISKDNLDLSADPATNFYQYACGGWIKNHPRPAAYARYGSFDQLAESTEKQLHKLMEDVTKKRQSQGTCAQKIADFYACGMDEKTTNKQKAMPITPILKQIAEVKNISEVTPLIAELHDEGFTPFFSLFGAASPNNSSLTIAWISQNGLGLEERDYYLTPDKNIKKGYLSMMEQLFAAAEYTDLSGEKADKLAARVWDIESAMANAFADKNFMRDPIKTTNVMTLAEVDRLMGAIDLKSYVAKRVPNSVSNVNVVQPDYLNQLDRILEQKDLSSLKAYLAWNVICHAAPYLSNDFVDAHFNFFGKTISGKEQNKERWQRVVSTVSDLLGEPVGQLYVEQYFPAEAKERMVQMVKNLKSALADRIQSNSWMTEETKQKALDKLSGMIVKVGYPDQWRDYKDLEIKKDGYYYNILRINKFESKYQLSKIEKPVDPSVWYMSPQTVNAYYEPSTNEICFPAAILQPPFFNMNADDAANYGAIGVVIGHEMTHGFDDQGRHYDKIGNVADWWTEDDSKNFSQRAQILVNYFNNIEVLPGLHADGQFTLGENIADNGGLNTSFVALQKAKEQGTIREEMDGFTADQRFFLAYAAVWANTITEQEIERRTKVDPHSLGEWRVNGALPHVDAFNTTFNLKPGDRMYLAPDKRARIW